MSLRMGTQRKKLLLDLTGCKIKVLAVKQTEDIDEMALTDPS